MSELAAVMKWSTVLLVVFLLTSTNIDDLHGDPTTGDHGLHCVHDYVFTINCSLSITPSANASDSNSSYWLTLIKDYELNTFVCKLTNTYENYFCSVKTSDSVPDEYASDMDTFKILLCHNQNDGPDICELLDGNYKPYINIKPNAPCCLTVRLNSSHSNFTWKSTYEEYSEFTGLVDSLMYELHFYKRGGEHKVIRTTTTDYSMNNSNLEPDTEYTATVRSSPDMTHYKGQWSDWSTEVHWKTASAMKDFPTNTVKSKLWMMVLIALCAMALLMLFLCYAPLKKWRQSAFIPTPAPYFHTLYSDCQGDFKSWVVTHKTAEDMLHEEPLQIDTLAKCAEVQEEECECHFPCEAMEGSVYSNVTGPLCNSSLLDIPYTASTVPPLSAPGSLLSSTLSSHAEGDSGCWLCSNTSLKNEPPCYYNEYCTLSAFQGCTPISAEQCGCSLTKSCPHGISKADAN
uniref:Fibronectin type-III domain-containing protein n=1 Tax=Monopterus albus TaxID=43700 RepID=A0A3Q3IF44_MONAL|nr:interleukin-21 receptor-like [Monopterus albus]